MRKVLLEPEAGPCGQYNPRVPRPTDAAIAALIALASSASPATAATDRQVRTVALPASRALSLEITVGDVTIEAGPRADAVIEIVRRAPSEDDLQRVPILIDERSHEVVVRAVQEDGNTVALFRSDVTLRVPVDAHIASVRMVEGRLSVNNLRGTLTADVRRGPVSATDVAGSFRIETGIGDITFARARVVDTGLLRLRAFNGNVKVTLAERPVDARILALALNGSIASDIPLTTKDTWGPRWAEATLGRGEPVISLETVMGSIEIRAGR